MADIVSLTQEELRQVEQALVRVQILESVVPKVITEVPMAKSVVQAFNKVVPPLASDHQMWSVANVAIVDGASVGFTPENPLVYRWQLTGHFPAFDLEVSRNAGESLDTITFEQLAIIHAKEKEKFVFSGTKPKGDRAAAAALTEGLMGKAGNTSTENTATLTTAGQFQLTVNDMIDQNEADDHGGPYVLVTNSRSHLFLRDLISVNAGMIERDIVMKSLTGGSIVYTDGMQNPAAADDAPLLLLENKPTNYRLKTYPLKVLMGTYNPVTDAIPFRIEAYHCLQVFKPNSICKHVTSDIS